MGRAKSAGEIAEIGIGMLGYAFMGKAHSKTVPVARVHGMAAASFSRRGWWRSQDATSTRSRRCPAASGSSAHVTGLGRDLVADPEIGLVDNGGPNDLHAEPTIAAAEVGQTR